MLLFLGGALATLGGTFATSCQSHGGYEEPSDGGKGGAGRDATVNPSPLDGGDAKDSGSSSSMDMKGVGAADMTASIDPFDPASCGGPALSTTQALSLLGANSRMILGDATLYRRTRSCTGMTPATCSAWSTPVIHDQSLLTYSGGVVTDYKTFTFPTHLILYSQAGTPKFSIRHESDYMHDMTADARGVLFSFGADPMANSYPIIYVWDFFPKPDRYDDLQGLLGDDGYLHVSPHCARVVFSIGIIEEIAALYTY